MCGSLRLKLGIKPAYHALVVSVGLLIVGDEVLRGDVREANAGAVIARLHGTTTRLVRQIVVPDEVEALAGELVRLQDLADLVIISGGIGPTHDDVTRPALAQALGRPLVHHTEAARRLRGFYGSAIAEAELHMARLPRGATLIVGPETGSFGFSVDKLYVLPGVPALFEDVLAGMGDVLEGDALPTENLVTRLREGELAPMLRATLAAHPEVTIGSYPVLQQGSWSVRLIVRSASTEACQHAATDLRKRIKDAAG